MTNCRSLCNILCKTRVERNIFFPRLFRSVVKAVKFSFLLSLHTHLPPSLPLLSSPLLSPTCHHPSYSRSSLSLPPSFRHAGAKRNLEGQDVYGDAAGLQPHVGRAPLGTPKVSEWTRPDIPLLSLKCLTPLPDPLFSPPS